MNSLSVECYLCTLDPIGTTCDKIRGEGVTVTRNRGYQDLKAHTLEFQNVYFKGYNIGNSITV